MHTVVALYVVENFGNTLVLEHIFAVYPSGGHWGERLQFYAVASSGNHSAKARGQGDF